MTVRLILIAAFGTAALQPAAAASAQDSGYTRVRVGLGAQVQPKFVGSDDHEVAPYWKIDTARDDHEFAFEAPDDHASARLYSKEGFAFGPAANLEGKRKESDVGAPVGDVKRTIELGGFAEYYVAKSVRLRGELLKGIGGHKGLVGAIGADKIWRDHDNYVVSFGPRLLFSDGRYQRAYFGVDTPAVLASGLPYYRPGGGLHAIALASGLTYQFTPKWGLVGYARAERLVGDAAKSPIVREFGSRNQLSAGLGLSYTFRVKN
jgi:outer membrane protein